jgi:N4-gp56 family major capsid protein
MFKYNFHLFDMNTNVTTAATKDVNDLSPEMKTFYDKVLIRAAEPELVHDQFGQKRPIPANNGKKIEFRKFSSLPKMNGTPLTEGVTPDGQSINVTKVESEIKQYGGYVTTSDLLELSAFDQVTAETLKLLGSQAGRTSDTITRDVLCTGYSVIYEGDAANRSALTTTSTLKIADIKSAVRFLKRNNAPKIGDSYVAIVHPDTAYDLMNDSEWIEAQKYTTSEKIFNGEIGKMYGVRFVESSEAKVWSSADASASVPVYATIVLGADAYGITSINGGGIETITKQLGSGGTADPLNQRATIGWKMNKTATILDDTKMVRIEHTCTNADDKSN